MKQRRRDPWNLIFAVGCGTLMGVLAADAVPFLIGAVVDGLGFSALRAGALGTAAALDTSGRVPAAAAGFNQILCAAGPVVAGLIAEAGAYRMIGWSAAAVCTLAALAAVALGSHFDDKPPVASSE